MFEQQHLDIGGIDVEAAGNDHVLLAIEQDDETVLVDLAHVTRPEEKPPVPVMPEEVPRLVFLLVVTLHHDLRAPRELTDLALRQHLALFIQHHDLAAQARLAHGVELVRMEIGLERARATSLGQAVDLDQTPRPALQAIGLDVGAQGGAGRELGLEGAEVVFLEVRVRQDALVLHRYQHGVGHPLALGDLQEFHHVRLRHQDGCAADADRGQYRDQSGVGIKRRRGERDRVGAVVEGREAHGQEIAHDVAVQNAFGQAGRA